MAGVRSLRRRREGGGAGRAAWPALALSALLLLPGRARGAGEIAGTWTVVHGKVEITRSGASGQPAARAGDPLVVGDLFETGKDARAQALLADGTVVNIGAGTSLRVLQYSFDPTGDRRTAVVKIQSGRARFIVAALKNSRFNVESAHASVAATAADFVAAVSPESTTVTTLEGAVKTKNLSKLIVEEVELWSNQTTTVRSGAAPSHPTQLDPQRRKEYRRDVRLF